MEAIFQENRTEENKMRYTEKRNKRMSPLRSEKLDEKKVVINKQCWKTMKPLISTYLKIRHIFKSSNIYLKSGCFRKSKFTLSKVISN